MLKKIKLKNSTILLIGILIIFIGIFIGFSEYFIERKSKAYSDMNILLYENELPQNIGENIDIIGIPIDTKVNLQEINHDGYKTVIKSGDETLADGDTYEFTITDSKEVTVHNIPGVELPETGGSGIQNYLILGLFLIIGSLSYGYKYYFGLKEGGR